MTDGRRKNNLSAAQRRKAAKAGRKPRRSRKNDPLEIAKTILRRTGKDVYDAKIEAPRFKGSVMVDTRMMSPRAVIEMANVQLLREWERNSELREQHNLPALPRPAMLEE